MVKMMPMRAGSGGQHGLPGFISRLFVYQCSKRPALSRPTTIAIARRPPGLDTVEGVRDQRGLKNPRSRCTRPGESRPCGTTGRVGTFAGGVDGSSRVHEWPHTVPGQRENGRTRRRTSHDTDGSVSGYSGARHGVARIRRASAETSVCTSQRVVRRVVEPPLTMCRCTSHQSKRVTRSSRAFPNRRTGVGR